MVETWLSGSEIWPNSSAIFRHISNIRTGLFNCVFFITAGKQFGTSKVVVSEGDVIAVLAGSKSPMVLCPVRKNEQVCYDVVGPCYCDGNISLSFSRSPKTANTCQKVS